MNRRMVFVAGVVTGVLVLGLVVLAWDRQVTVVATVPDAALAPPPLAAEPAPPHLAAEPAPRVELPAPVTPAVREPASAPPRVAVAVAPPSSPEPGELPPGANPPEAGPLPALSLLIPVEGIAAAQLSDTFTDARGAGRLHDAIDIMAPTGTPVRAVADGRIVKLFNSKAGGLTIYQFDGDDTVAFYYAHLDRYAEGIAEGQAVKQGDLVGYVGYTGNASPDGPHLHFAIMVLGPEKNWWQGRAINPYPYLRQSASL